MVGDGGGESKVWWLPARSSLSLLVLGCSFFFFAEALVKRFGRTIRIRVNRCFANLFFECGAAAGLGLGWAVSCGTILLA